MKDNNVNFSIKTNNDTKVTPELKKILDNLYIGISNLTYEQHYQIINECLRVAYVINVTDGWINKEPYERNKSSKIIDIYKAVNFIHQKFTDIMNFLIADYDENKFTKLLTFAEFLQFIYDINNIIWREKIEKNNKMDFNFIEINKDLISDLIILPVFDSDKKYDKNIFEISNDFILDKDFVANIFEIISSNLNTKFNFYYDDFNNILKEFIKE